MLLKLVVFPSLGKEDIRKLPCWTPQWSNGARIMLQTDPTEYTFLSPAQLQMETEPVSKMQWLYINSDNR